MKFKEEAKAFIMKVVKQRLLVLSCRRIPDADNKRMICEKLRNQLDYINSDVSMANFLRNQVSSINYLIVHKPGTNYGSKQEGELRKLLDTANAIHFSSKMSVSA